MAISEREKRYGMHNDAQAQAQAEQLRFCTVFRKDERLGQIMISTLFLPQVFRGG